LRASEKPLRATGSEQEAVTGKTLDGSFQSALKSGEVLCELVNHISPGAVPKIQKPVNAFKERENIVAYIEACKKLGLKESDCFVSQDLHEGDNMVLVIDQIYHLAGFANSSKTYNGPKLAHGVKHSQAAPREFSEEKIIEGKKILPQQNQGSKKIEGNIVIDRQIIRDHSGHAASSTPSQQTLGSKSVEKEKRLDKIVRPGDNAAPADGSIPIFAQGDVARDERATGKHLDPTTRHGV